MSNSRRATLVGLIASSTLFLGAAAYGATGASMTPDLSGENQPASCNALVNAPEYGPGWKKYTNCYSSTYWVYEYYNGSWKQLACIRGSSTKVYDVSIWYVENVGTGANQC